jgi:hypothetical protein
MKIPSVRLGQKTTSTARFDPFNNRLSRDIRNSLAEAFVDALPELDKSRFRGTAEQWLANHLDDVYADYVHARLKRYHQVIDAIKLNRIQDAKLQGLIIWNHGLFFEFHEHFERIWHQTTGDDYQALKGLIQAAGVYIHLKFNHRKAAARLADKSSARIKRYSACLAFIANLDLLLKKLEALDIVAPQLISNPDQPE